MDGFKKLRRFALGCNVAWANVPEPRAVRQCMYYERKGKR